MPWQNPMKIIFPFLHRALPISNTLAAQHIHLLYRHIVLCDGSRLYLRMCVYRFILFIYPKCERMTLLSIFVRPAGCINILFAIVRICTIRSLVHLRYNIPALYGGASKIPFYSIFLIRYNLMLLCG